jgi:hypothetical protein
LFAGRVLDMTAIAPLATDSTLPTPSTRRVRHFPGVATRWLLSLAERLPGHCTVSKLDAFEQFRLQSSGWQAAAILLLTPLPCLAVNLLLESLPLADPTTGFRHSVAFQTRHVLASVVQTSLPAFVKKNCVPDFPTGNWKMIAGFGVIQGLAAVSTNAIISLSTGVFPVFFAHFTPALPMGIIGTLICYRRQSWGPELPDFRAKATQVDNRLGMEMLPIFVYPVFTALFMALSSSKQMWLSLCLPFIKLALRRWLWVVSKDDQDLVGVITCCVGHWYHILFTNVILQNAKSFDTVAVIVLFNAGQMLLNCRYILQDAKGVDEATRKLEASHVETLTSNSVCNALLFGNNHEIAANLHAKKPSALLSTYPGYHGKAFVHRHSKRVRGSSSLSLPSLAHVKRMSVSAVKRVEQNADNSKSTTKTTSSSWSIPGNNRFVQVLPASDNPNRPSPLDIASAVDDAVRLHSPLTLQPIEPLSTASRELYIHSIASALHQTEMILLRSYITIFATALYGEMPAPNLR